MERVLSPLRHELRNVLTPISIMADVLALRGPSVEISVLVRDVRLLGLMFEDLCELTRGTHDQVALDVRSVELADVVARVVEATAPHLLQVGASIVVAVPAGLRIAADPALLELALASVVRHLAAPAARLALDATRESGAIGVRMGSAGEPLPDSRALGFAQHLVELQAGTWDAGTDLHLSLPVAPMR